MTGPARDRDQLGRARNARPRDALGRPLPRGAAGVEQLPEDLRLPPTVALVEAQRLLDGDRPFQAHEVLEAAWKAAPAAERELWRGLAQLAVGLTHLARGNRAGAAALLRRGGERVGGYAGGAPYGVDAAGLARWAGDQVAALEAAGAAGSAGADVRRRPPPRLTGPPPVPS